MDGGLQYQSLSGGREEKETGRDSALLGVKRIKSVTYRKEVTPYLCITVE